MSRRSNQEWVEALRGERGLAQLEASHKDLANYLYKVASNYLVRRQAQANPWIFTTFTSEQLDHLAEEFAQDALEKLVANKLALLDKFQGKGAFSSWMATIITRLIAGELRKAKWQRRVSLPESASFFEPRTDLSLQNCLDKLTEKRRQALWACKVEKRSVEEVADEMGKSKSAVYSLVAQAKRDLRNCLKDSN